MSIIDTQSNPLCLLMPEKKKKKPIKLEIKEIPLSQISVSRLNIRKNIQSGTEDSTLNDLANSINEKGLINPITVLSKAGKFEVIVGQRRFMACQLLHWKTIPAIIKTNLDEVDVQILSLIENVHRAELNPIDKANAYDQIYERLRTYTNVSRETGVSVSTISRYHSLLKLAPSIQQILTTSGGPAGIVTLSKLADMFESFEDQEYVFGKISGFKQQIQLEILKQSNGDISKIDLLCQQALGGCFSIFVCHGLDSCPHIPKECLEKVKRVIALEKESNSFSEQVDLEGVFDD